MSIAYEHILASDEGPFTTVTLNRPERMNATTWRMMAELRHAIAAADADESIRAIIVTGAGRAFCAGADLSGSAFARNEEQAEERLRVTDELVPPGTKMFWEMNTPIIAAINGTAVGVGITLPLYFDIRIVAEDAKLGFLFSRRGIIPEWNSPWLLPRLTGLSRAMELLTTGRFFSGDDAVEWGIATEALPADQVVARAREIAMEIAENTSAISVGIAKRLIYDGLECGDAEAFRQRTSEIFRWSTKQADGREGPKAFMEKRKPRFPMNKNADFPEEFFGRP
jgi:enoyl-CoA hydratase/carnithine racemase